MVGDLSRIQVDDQNSFLSAFAVWSAP